MALTRTKNCYIATAAGDSLDQNVRVTSIRVVTGGASGQAILLDQNGGREIWRSAALNANSADETVVDAWVDGFYVSQLPAGATLYVYFK